MHIRFQLGGKYVELVSWEELRLYPDLADNSRHLDVDEAVALFQGVKGEWEAASALRHALPETTMSPVRL